MPTYEYACQACGNELEAQQRIIEPALKTCPACGKDTLERLISRTSFQLKGGGWYKDLYASSSGKPRSDNDRTDSLQKAINDDKSKSAAPAASSDSSPTTSTPAASPSASASPSTSSSSSSSSSGSGGSSGGGSTSAD